MTLTNLLSPTKPAQPENTPADGTSDVFITCYEGTWEASPVQKLYERMLRFWTARPLPAPVAPVAAPSLAADFSDGAEVVCWQ